MAAYARVIQGAHRLATADRKSREAVGLLDVARADAVAAVADMLPLLDAESKKRIVALLSAENYAAGDVI